MKKVGNKVVVVGLGAVGVSYAYSMLNQAFSQTNRNKYEKSW